MSLHSNITTGEGMTQDEIIEMARQAGKHQWPFDLPFLERFAKLVAQHEREACADIAENWNSNGFPRTGVANEIRARGQA
jgi:hypothetical protein